MTATVAQVLTLVRQLSPREQLELIQTLAALAQETLDSQSNNVLDVESDPMLEIIGAYAHDIPLIDDIAPSAFGANARSNWLATT
ncbi:MAG: hypothetical protein EI684_20095 [Candidatus Viridilinea halotolerans]|uniref:Uncharacterized protein n=1 Tax=Candidatus Viridilinea halotolerans TaxID=2491704 RepID=A0A426TSA5_9CHLR|nr:MAG: hypothetical protein EI684_20095 [Candidatus Viridilinea halotolerans]